MDFLVTMLIHLLGLFVSLFAIFVIVENSSILVPSLRRGIMSYTWGLGFLALSFFWKIMSVFFPIGYSENADSFFLLASVVLLLSATVHLFRMRTA